eukprot:TRINITY_DN45708_c0_g1_i1.p1 TRINITY_DN45708_c0_g1~~TRINITY_DN45708_c0_g1_i1.p1  ORF type:complete len:532 (+),score=135.49 TRINITY_DN45708_c0_g1_i1:163-1596(+)
MAPRVYRARRPVVSALAALLLGGLPAASAADPVQLPGHSIHVPVDVHQLGAEWLLEGTVVPLADAMCLSPGVPNRVGMLWSMYPLLTGDFEVVMKFKLKPPEKATAKNEGFAFWYVNENAATAQNNVSVEHVRNQDAIVANTWEMGLTKAGFDLLGYRSKFDGLGVIVGPNAAGEPVLKALHNDGKTEYQLSNLLGSGDAIKLENNKDLTVKIRVQATEAKIEVVDKGSVEVKAPFKSGGYIGFTSYGGSKGDTDNFERSNFVTLADLSVLNHDASAKGEDIPKPSTAAPVAKTNEEKEDVLRNASSHKDHRAESDAIKELTNMVFKLVAETQPMRAQLTTAISSLSTRIDHMEQTFENLKQEIDKKTGHHLSEEFDVIKKELTSLSTVASQVTQERGKKLEALHTDISDVHKQAHSNDNIDHHLNKLTESNQRTLDSLNNEHQRMFGVSIAAIAFVVIAGLSLYNKFRCWEKKHIL